MKLKEWGLMRHKPRKTAKRCSDNNTTDMSGIEEDDRDERDSSATVEPVSLEQTPSASCEKEVGWKAGWKFVPDAELMDTEPTFMGLLRHTPK
jgi:hypothetical protein